MNREQLESIVPILKQEDIYFFLKFGFISTSNWDDYKTYFEEYQNDFWFKASLRGNLNVIKFLIGIGIDIELKDCEGRTTLMYSAEKGRLNIVKLLLESNADIETQNNWKNTPLTYAVYYGGMAEKEYEPTGIAITVVSDATGEQISGGVTLNYPLGADRK